MEYKPGELEKRIETPLNRLTKTVDVIESTKKYRYFGKIDNIFEYEGEIKGRYSIKKFEVIDKKILGIPLPEISMFRYSFSPSNYSFDLIINTSGIYPLNSSTDFLEIESGRRALYLIASNQGIILKKTLFDLVFGDLERKLFEFYKDRKELKLILSKDTNSQKSTKST